MIDFKRFVLKNGLHVILHEDNSTPLVSCNIVYNVGSRDENPTCTGLAHLMEHYMFCGSKNIPDYDTPLQQVGAINNAYTTHDLTHYYCVVPSQNIETALWLESDRMLELAFSQEHLDVQKHVVCEEFKERFLNVPFGDVWLIFNDLIYEHSPYKWLPIGKSLEHIEKVDLPTIKDFYYRFYRPSNAVLVLAGNIHAEDVMPLVEKWFGDIPAGCQPKRNYLLDDVQKTEKRLSVEREVPYGMLLKGWKSCGRLDRDFYTLDLLSDLFGSGRSSYLYQELVLKRKLFVDITAFLSGTFLQNMFVVVGHPAAGVSLEQADEALSDFLYTFQCGARLSSDLQKVKNVSESSLLENEIRINDRASSLAISETYSRVEDFSDESKRYFSVTEENISAMITSLLVPRKATTLFYHQKK